MNVLKITLQKSVILQETLKLKSSKNVAKSSNIDL